MAAPHEFVALSFLSASRWRWLVEPLRAGVPPVDLLRQQCALLRKKCSDAPEAQQLLVRSAGAVARGRAAGLELITLLDPRYPGRLATTADPSPVLWARGDLPLVSRPTVAIVGARAASPYGLSVAERLASDLAAQGVVIVSGLARGIDAAAHRGALLTGTTIAVLGCGADVVYPAEHDRITAEIAARGLVLSELAPGTRPLPHFFPQRNRIISGLSQAVVIIEAGEQSGSLITARCALEQGRDVLAVPGNVLNGRNKGAHALLRDGARVVESAADVLDEIGYPNPETRAGEAVSETGQPDPAVMAGWRTGETRDLDEISAISGLPAAEILPRLLALELAGSVRRVGGGQFVRIDRTC